MMPPDKNARRVNLTSKDCTIYRLPGMDQKDQEAFPSLKDIQKAN